MHLPIRIGFVCQSGRLEAQACLLAASIRENLGKTVTLTAAIPTRESNGEPPSLATIDFLQSLNVSIEAITNPISSQYPIGNKLACLKLLEQAEGTALFLDSDMLVLQTFFSVFSGNFDLMAKPADLPTSGLAEEQWLELMSHHGLRPPRSR